MNIGIDIDDTICNTREFMAPYAQMFAIERGRSPKIADPDKRLVMDVLGWSAEDTKAYKKSYWNKIIPNVPLKPHVCKTLEQLRTTGDKIYFITARDRAWDMFDDPYNLSARYLEQHGIKYDGLVVESLDKLSACQELDIDVLIEDNLDICKKVLLHGIRPILFATPYNKDCGSIERAHSWAEIYYILKGALVL